MTTLRNVLVALFRPAKGVDGAAAALKWLWIPLALLLLGSVAVKTVVSTPMQIEESQKVTEAQIESAKASMSDAERKDFEAATEGTDQSVDIAAGSAIVSTAAMVFAVLGAAFSIVYIATFFFVAAKTWANPVAYRTMLSIASLSLVPHALRNVVQAVYMASSGVWLQHPGLGALVAPADALDPPGVMYAVLSQVDIWVLWGVAILFGALLSQTMGIGRKRAMTGMITFIAITGILQALPTLISGVFLGAM